MRDPLLPSTPAPPSPARATVRALAAVALAAAVAVACIRPSDLPQRVEDLRVLGMALEPPEVLMRACTPPVLRAIAAAAATDAGFDAIPPELALRLVLEAAAPVELRALVADPAGEGRGFDWELFACDRPSERRCADLERRVSLGAGRAKSGELSATVRLGAQLFPDGGSLLLSSLQADLYQGLGGIRVPVLLVLTAPDTGERIFAQKLMVFQCNLFPETRQNVNPTPPPLALDGEAWEAAAVPEVRGAGPFAIEADGDEVALGEETYVVPTFSLQPLTLRESWKIARYVTHGDLTPYETGGATVPGTAERHRSLWRPASTMREPTEVRFWFVVRDGRGGQAWTERRLRWSP